MVGVSKFGKCVRCSNSIALGRSKRFCELHLDKDREAKNRYLKTEKGQENREKHRSLYRDYLRTYRRGMGRFEYVKRHAVRHGKAWTLTKSEYSALICRPCDYCGLPNNVTAGSGLDRLDNRIGYSLGNVVPCCSECNFARRDTFTPSEMKIIGSAIRQVKLARLGLC